MRLKELLNSISEKTVNGILDEERELIPTFTPDECSEDSLLFITRKVGGSGILPLPVFKKRPYAILTDGILSQGTDIPAIYTKEARSALSIAYKLHYGLDKSTLKLVGVTGTNGKTTTATLIYEILLRCNIKAGFIGTGYIKCCGKLLSDEGYTMTTPDPSVLYKTLRQMQDDACEVVVMEVSSHALALHKVDGLDFTLGIFTNLSSEHMDFHSDMEEYFNTKMRLFSNCAISLFNVDDYYGNRAYNTCSGKKRGVGILESSDIYATDINLNGLSGSEFLYRTDNLIFKAQLALPGAYNVYNALMALAAVIELGIKPCLAKVALASIKSVTGRLEIIHERPHVIIDYAHTPEALKNLLKSIKAILKPRQKLILVFGCGGDRDTTKRHLMGKTAIQYADKVVITEDNNRTESFDAIATDIVADIQKSTRYIIIPDRYAAIKYALGEAKTYDVVAIVGKGHERYIIDCDGMRPFDERMIVREHYGEDNEGQS